MTAAAGSLAEVTSPSTAAAQRLARQGEFHPAVFGPGCPAHGRNSGPVRSVRDNDQLAGADAQVDQGIPHGPRPEFGYPHVPRRAAAAVGMSRKDHSFIWIGVQFFGRILDDRFELRLDFGLADIEIYNSISWRPPVFWCVRGAQITGIFAGAITGTSTPRQQESQDCYKDKLENRSRHHNSSVVVQ